MIGQRLKYFRAVQNLTQRDLAIASGVSAGHVGTIEKRSKEVTLTVAIKLKNALGLKNVEQLVEPMTQAEKENMKRLTHLRIKDRDERRRKQRRNRRIRHRERMKLLEGK